jgi:hypothetical protein
LIAIEAFGQSNGIGYGNLLRIHRIGPDFKIDLAMGVKTIGVPGLT